MTAAILIALLSSSTALAQEAPETEEPQRPLLVGIDLAPYAGTSSALPDAPRYISLNLIGGLSGGTRFFELGGVLNIDGGPLTGLQVGGAVNINSHTVTGAQIAGATNINGGTTQGLQIAGAANVVGGDLRGGSIAGATNIIAGSAIGARLAGAANIIGHSNQGLQVAGAANVVGDDHEGMQIAGATNIIGGTSEGALLAGAVNFIGYDAQGLQIAGGTNISAQTLQGAQVAGGVNYTHQNVQGLQIAPVNITGGDVQGLQLGVVNIAKTTTASIGLIGIYLDGFTQPEVYLSEEGLLLAGIRHGSKNFYNIYSIGTRLFGGPSGLGPAIAASLGFGWRLDLSDRLELSFDLTTTSIITETKEWNWKSYFNVFKFRPLLSVDLLDSVAIFGGPTLAMSLPTDNSTVSADDFALIDGWHLGNDIRIWPGFLLGARFF